MNLLLLRFSGVQQKVNLFFTRNLHIYLQDMIKLNYCIIKYINKNIGY